VDFLTQVAGEGAPVELTALALRLGSAFALGLLAAGVYAVACRWSGRRAEPSFLTTLVLLSLLISLVTLVIGNNVARAFSLVGTLAIVRFRTVVEDTRDTAFVIYSVACGMCAGSGYILGPVACAPLVLTATWLFAGLNKTGVLPDRLTLRLSSGTSADGPIRQALDTHLPAHRLLGVDTARGGSAFDATYAVKLPPPQDVYALVKLLSAIEGVQEVEVKSQC